MGTNDGKIVLPDICDRLATAAIPRRRPAADQSDELAPPLKTAKVLEALALESASRDIVVSALMLNFVPDKPGRQGFIEPSRISSLGSILWNWQIAATRRFISALFGIVVENRSAISDRIRIVFEKFLRRRNAK
jgi:hypothetical protein